MSLKIGNYSKKPTTPNPTPYSAFNGIQGNVGTSQIPNVPMATPEELGYPSIDIEAQIAAFDASQRVATPYSNVAVDTFPDLSTIAFNSLNGYQQLPNSNVSTRSNNVQDGELGNYYSLMLGKESSNNYQAVNDRGYIGGYQMREKSLIDAGYVKPGTTKAGLDNPKNWYNGLSKDKFLANPEIQDAAVRAFTEKNKKYLGDVYTNASPSERRGLLASSHLIGAGGTKKNMHSVDANNVSGMDYYNYFTTH